MLPFITGFSSTWPLGEDMVFAETVIVQPMTADRMRNNAYRLVL